MNGKDTRMKTRKYLKTVEDVLALKDTDTKIYVHDESGYYKFVNGVLCAFDDKDNSWSICSTLYGPAEIYIIEEEPMQEATEEDLGKLCWFFDDENINKYLSVLKSISEDKRDKYRSGFWCWHYHCRPLTKEEIKKFMEKAEC